MKIYDDDDKLKGSKNTSKKPNEREKGILWLTILEYEY